MRRFFQASSILDPVRRELSWTHYRTLLRVENDQARQWYMNEAANQNLSTRALERQLGTLYYERLLASSDRSAVEQEALANLTPLQRTPREFVRDPVMLEFLGLPGSGKLLESDLEQALLDHLQEFLLELGKGFAFVARQQRISTESKDFYIDLVFYNFLLKCFALFDLKSTELTHQNIGQMDMYVRMTDEMRRGPDDKSHGRHHSLRAQKTHRLFVSPCCTETNSCSRRNTSLCCHRRTSCELNSTERGHCWRNRVAMRGRNENRQSAQNSWEKDNGCVSNVFF